jgi:hypothetical protein
MNEILANSHVRLGRVQPNVFSAQQSHPLTRQASDLRIGNAGRIHWETHWLLWLPIDSRWDRGRNLMASAGGQIAAAPEYI